jgi:single-strand DNA-binding protein
MINKCILVGRVGKDAMVRYTQGGTPQASFSLCTTETWKNKEGAKQEKNEWHQIVAWGKLAEICGEYVTKGMLLYIEGKVTYRQWEGKEGEKHFITEIVTNVMKMLGGGNPKAIPPKENQEPKDQAPGPTAQDDEDIPF